MGNGKWKVEKAAPLEIPNDHANETKSPTANGVPMALTRTIKSLIYMLNLRLLFRRIHSPNLTTRPVASSAQSSLIVLLGTFSNSPQV